MSTSESVETDALDELSRIECFENLVDSGEMLDEAEIASALCDASEPIRAEALDYLAGIPPTAGMIDVVAAAGRSETAVQCVARIAFLSYAWHNTALRDSLTYRPTLDEAEYIAIWDDAGRMLISGEVSAGIRLCSYAEYGDWELKTVARNLIETVAEMNSEAKSIFSKVLKSLSLNK